MHADSVPMRFASPQLRPAPAQPSDQTEHAAAELPRQHLSHPVIPQYRDRFESGNPLGQSPSFEMRRETPGLEFDRVHQTAEQAPVGPGLHQHSHSHTGDEHQPEALVLKAGLDYLENARNAAKFLCANPMQAGIKLQPNALFPRRESRLQVERLTGDESTTTTFIWPQKSAFTQHVESLAQGARHESGNGKTIL